ncbi:MAG: RNA-binding transcriptional accessory protein [Ignavibacteriae bacterium]|nr:MAG: RNA-binding transcriptional accessory protein [Ignavibacteriota bacterium]
MDIINLIAKKLDIKSNQINEVLKLFAEEATIPFIARYRKERTGGLDEEQLREIETLHNYLTLLQERKETVLKSIEEQGKLTEELKAKIEAADKLQDVEDLYLPYKPKRKTRGTVAKAKGLEPLANFIINNPNFNEDFEEILKEYIDEEKEVLTTEDALQGAKDIIAEMISDNADVRKLVRESFLNESNICSTKTTKKEDDKNSKKKDVYEIYHDFQIEITRVKPYQVLAINRGEREGFLKISFQFDKDDLLNKVFSEYFNFKKSNFEEILRDTTTDSFRRLIQPSIEREIRNHLTELADEHAVSIFSSNLKQLLLQPPILNKRIMGIDPGFVSGSKVAVIDETGKYIEGNTIYPHPPQKKKIAAKKVILDLVQKYDIQLIAIGNGTASRETELLVSEIIKENNLTCHYLIVNEAGASVYSASPVAKQEFPDLEASQRGNISIARRVLDPLAELVKIDPKSIGVGLYQHDVDQKMLNKNLDDVVVSCVNYVGVDLNTASSSLLNYVSGLSKRIAKNIVKFRDENGKFTDRNQLKEISGVGEKLFEQAAGFLKISDGINPLDSTFIHPESYKATEELLNMCNISSTAINEQGMLVKFYVEKNGLQNIAEKLNIGVPTLEDIVENILKPGRDPREDMPKPILRSDILKIEDLENGMALKGTVRNVVDFGAFVDIGVKQDGLLHISEMANKFVKSPLDVVNVGDVIDVTIKSVDIEKNRIALSMK